MTKYLRTAVLTISLSLFLYNAVYANGVPVIFGVTVVHLLIINSIVMIVEARLLREISKSNINPWWMILANIASIFLAYLLADNTISTYLHTQWFGLSEKGVIKKKYFIAGVAVFIVFTILIEWLFFYLAQKTNRQFLKSLKFSSIINLATNIPIAIFYLLTDSYYETGD